MYYILLHNHNMRSPPAKVSNMFFFLIWCESVESVWCFMVQISHFHTKFKNILDPFAGRLLIF